MVYETYSISIQVRHSQAEFKERYTDAMKKLVDFLKSHKSLHGKEISLVKYIIDKDWSFSDKIRYGRNNILFCVYVNMPPKIIKLLFIKFKRKRKYKLFEVLWERYGGIHSVFVFKESNIHIARKMASWIEENGYSNGEDVFLKKYYDNGWFE